MKGTLFIRSWRETYRRSASALNQPRLLDMLNGRAAEHDRLWWKGWGSDMEVEMQNDIEKLKEKGIKTEDRLHLALLPLCRSHQIFSLTFL